MQAIYRFFSLVSSRAFRDAPHSRFRCENPNQCLPNFLKMLLLALPQIYTRVFHLWKSIDFGQCLGERFSPISTFFSLVRSRAFRDAPHSRFWCRDFKLCLLDFFKDARFSLFSNLDTCILHVVVCRFGRCLGWRFSPIYIFFSVACFRAFRDEPHFVFRCPHL